MEGGIRSMNNTTKCKRCGQTKDKSEFYKGSHGICKLCRYVPKHSVRISITVHDTNNVLEFTGVTDYKFEGVFLKIEDAKDIHYIKIDSIFRITVKKQTELKTTERGLKFTTEPIIL